MSAPGSRSTRGRAIVTALASGSAILAVAAPTWFSVPVTTLLHGESMVAVSGTGAVPALTGIALVLLAAGGALGIVGQAGRRVVGVLVLLAGVVAVWLVTDVLRAPDAALRRTVAEQTGVGAVPDAVVTSPWPIGALVVTVLVLALGASLMSGKGPWPAPGARVRRSSDRPGGIESSAPADDPTSVWDALSDGDDPTAPGRLP